MTNIRALDPERHRSSCFDRNAVAATRRLVQIGFSEIALAAADMPLCLAKDTTTGRFNLVALLGLIEPANLFSIDGRLHATYLPRSATVSCFRLDRGGAAGLAIDEADAAIGRSGRPLIENGAPAPFLNHVRDLLHEILADIGAAQRLVDHYAGRRLLRPLNLSLRLADGREQLLDGLYTIDTDTLDDLPDEDVIALHRVDALTMAGVLTASLAQVERLRQLHNARYDNAIVAIDMRSSPLGEPPSPSR